MTGAGASLREHRHRRGHSLSRVSEATGISVSTLSRLESGERVPGLAHLVALASAYRVGLDELVGAHLSEDPRLRFELVERDGRTIMPLAKMRNGLAVIHTIIHPGRGAPPSPAPHAHGGEHAEPEWEYEPEMMRRHRGYVWVLVLAGRLRVLVGSRDLVLQPGEAVEFDTRLAHWLGPADSAEAEILGVHGQDGQRIRVRARPRDR